MVIHGPNGNFENKGNYSIKKQSGSEIKKSDKPTNEEITSQMKSEHNSEDIPMGFKLYHGDTDEHNLSSVPQKLDEPAPPSSDEPTVPTEPTNPDDPTLYGPPEPDEPTVPTEPTEPDDPTLYGPPEPDEPTAPPTEPNTGIESATTSSIPKGRADGHTIARNDADFYNRFPSDKFKIIYKQGNIYFFKKIN